jgi:hypothetical protein
LIPGLTHSYASLAGHVEHLEDSAKGDPRP